MALSSNFGNSDQYNYCVSKKSCSYLYSCYLKMDKTSWAYSSNWFIQTIPPLFRDSFSSRTKHCEQKKYQNVLHEFFCDSIKFILNGLYGTVSLGNLMKYFFVHIMILYVQKVLSIFIKASILHKTSCTYSKKWRQRMCSGGYLFCEFTFPNTE